jgi:rod shape-determining protein MreB
MATHNRPLALDLGSQTIRLAVCSPGGLAATTHEQPALVLISRPPLRVVAVGREAAEIAEGSLPPGVEALRPLRGGLIASLDPAVALIRAALHAVMGGERGLAALRRKPPILVALPATATDSERAAVSAALRQVGWRRVGLVPGPLAAAVGAEVPGRGGRPQVLCDLGAGKVEAAVVRNGGVALARTWRLGGDWLDAGIIRAVRRRRGHLITPAMAEQARIASGEISPLPTEEEVATGRKPGTGPLRRRRLGTGPLMERVTAGGTFEIAHANRHTKSGLPEFNSDDMRAGLLDSLRPLLENLAWFWEDLPAEAREAATDDGVTLTGGLAQTPGLADTLAHLFHTAVRVADAPAAATLRGLADLSTDQLIWTAPWPPLWETD